MGIWGDPMKYILLFMLFGLSSSAFAVNNGDRYITKEGCKLVVVSMEPYWARVRVIYADGEVRPGTVWESKRSLTSGCKLTDNRINLQKFSQFEKLESEPEAVEENKTTAEVPQAAPARAGNASL